MFSYILTLTRELQSSDFRPLRISLVRTPKDSINKLADILGAPIEFGASGNSILFSKEQVKLPLRFGNPSWAAKQDRLTEQYIAELGLISEYMLRVKTEIARLLDLGDVSIKKVAENLHVTVRTLQRRLTDENSSYHGLLDKLRYDLAMNYIADPNISVTDIAFKLGFNDSSSFSRNFKRWSNLSFSDYRSMHGIR